MLTFDFSSQFSFLYFLIPNEQYWIDWVIVQFLISRLIYYLFNCH